MSFRVFRGFVYSEIESVNSSLCFDGFQLDVSRDLGQILNLI